MAVVIRMKRAGARKRPFYRVVVADSRSPRDGRYIEQLGYYDPLTNPATFRVDADKFATWVRRGAVPSESVGVMMAKHAPEALRPAPQAPPSTPEAPEEEAASTTRSRTKRARVEKKEKAGRSRASNKPKARPKATKGAAKKAKARAKKKAGIVKPRAMKKSKKTKK